MAHEGLLKYAVRSACFCFHFPSFFCILRFLGCPPRKVPFCRTQRTPCSVCLKRPATVIVRSHLSGACLPLQSAQYDRVLAFDHKDFATRASVLGFDLSFDSTSICSGGAKRGTCAHFGPLVTHIGICRSVILLKRRRMCAGSSLLRMASENL